MLPSHIWGMLGALCLGFVVRQSLHTSRIACVLLRLRFCPAVFALMVGVSLSSVHASAASPVGIFIPFLLRLECSLHLQGF